MMKKILLLLLTMCFISACTTKNAPSEIYEDMKIDYQNIQEESRFMKVSSVEALDLINSRSGIFYFGYPDCDYCKQAVPILNKVATQTQSYIYYTNVVENGGLNIEVYNFLANIGAEKLGWDKDKVFVPLVISFDKGLIKDVHEGLLKGVNAHEAEMNDEQKTELEEIYKNLIKTIGG